MLDESIGCLHTHMSAFHSPNGPVPGMACTSRCPLAGTRPPNRRGIPPAKRICTYVQAVEPLHTTAPAYHLNPASIVRIHIIASHSAESAIRSFLHRYTSYQTLSRHS